MSQEGGAAGDEFRKMVIVGGDVEGEVGAPSSRNDFYLDSDGKSLKDSKKKHGIICFMTQKGAPKLPGEQTIGSNNESKDTS